MLKWLKQNRANVMACIVVLFLLWLSYSSQSFQNCIYEKHNLGAENAFNKSIANFLVAGGVVRGCTEFFVSKSGDAITALATFIIALFTWTLWRSSREQSALTRQAIIETSRQHVASNRAFVFLKSFVITGNYGPNAQGKIEFWRIAPVIENSGNTATKHMVSFHSAVLVGADLPKTFDYTDTWFPPIQSPTEVGRDIIGPHSQINGAPYILSIADVLAVQKGQKKFFVWGWSDYNDIFEATERHRTEYCFKLTVTLDPTNPKNSSGLVMGLFGHHNAIDDQCSKVPAPYTAA